MPNYCDFTMKIVGKKENVNEFISVLQADYDYEKNPSYCSFDRHLWRIFSADKVAVEYLNDTEYSATISGYCAWSVYCCMFKGEYTYANDDKDGLSKGTDIQTESANLNLAIEIFSSEPGVEFQEHYIVKDGEIVLDETAPYAEYCMDDLDNPEETFKELQEQYGDTSLTYEQAKSMEDEVICFGGIENYGVFSI